MLKWLKIPVYRLEIPVYRLEIPVYRLEIPLYLLEIPVYRLGLPLYRLEIPVYPLDLPVRVNGYLRQEKMNHTVKTHFRPCLMAETTSFSVKVGAPKLRVNYFVIFRNPRFRAFRPCLMAETTSFSAKVGFSGGLM
jgi:hypothetical protein